MGHAKVAIKKGVPATPTEHFLAALAEHTFLRLWSYPSVYRDQGNGKEICDLLAVFENHVVVFSDKFCEFPNTGNLSVDWNRWYSRAIKKAAAQAVGAERWLRSHPSRVFTDKTCSTPLPVPLPYGEDAVYHRVVVAHGSIARAKEYWLDAHDGSLLINSSLRGDDHYCAPLEPDPDRLNGPQFQIGHVLPDGGYVHVLDTDSFVQVMQLLDTAGIGI